MATRETEEDWKEFYIHLTFLTFYLQIPCYKIDGVISGKYPGSAKGNQNVRDIFQVDY